MKHIIVGTAGHVDHGKTELTLRLTGVNTDRLPEEQKRGMTIELGFVPLTLPDGQRLGLIDVPGHERFVKTMLAGVAGIDLVLLVVAADEGVMPQTVEHLHILHLLGIEHGVVVITKADLVEAEWLDLIREQVAELVVGTSLAKAPVLAVSARTGQGLAELVQVLAEVAAQVKPKTTAGHCRLPIDRVFSKVGFGTVVTGTLWQGSLRQGETVEVWPGAQAARVRGLQVHGAAVEEAAAGQRTAVNLAGLEVGQLPRGGWLAAPKLLRESWRLDVELRLLADAKALPQRCRLRVHHGTAEVLARLQLLDREELAAGESCYCQLLLEKPLPPLRGDRLILRSYSPMLTIGGATVLDANPPRHKRYRPQVVEALRKQAEANPASLVGALLSREKRLFSAADLAQQSQLPLVELQPVLDGMLASGQLLALGPEQEWYTLPSNPTEWLDEVMVELSAYHKRYPLRAGLPLATVRSQFFPQLSQKQLAAVVEYWRRMGQVRASQAWLALADYRPQPTPQQQAWLQALQAAYEEKLFEPPDWQELCDRLQIPAPQWPELLLWQTEQGQLQKIGEFYFSAQALPQALQQLREQGGAAGFTLAQARDWLASSRKYVLPLLEYCDQQNITVRQGEKRIFQANAGKEP